MKRRGENSKSGRYSLCAPVEGGCQWWMINDLKRMYAIVQISVHYPGAEAAARKLFEPLRAQ
jgi:aminopeptidase C